MYLSDVLPTAWQAVPLEDAPHMYEIFQAKQDGAFKVLLKP
jgi:threonine dehydrogenase-like Zn-dependent dehydrogenase